MIMECNNSSAQRNYQSLSARKKLSALPLAIFVFFNVSGGPFGIEQTIRSSGNFYALIGFLVAPFVFSLPEALVTAELGSAFPESAGGVAWVEEAFGPRAGFVCGYLTWISSATKNAVYPTLFVEYLTSALSFISEYEKHELLSGWSHFLVVTAISISLACINYTGLEIVGTGLVVVCILSMSPFVIMFFAGLPQVDPSKWLQMPDTTSNVPCDDDSDTSPGPIPFLALGGILWRPYLNNLFWKHTSFDAAAFFAGEVRDKGRTYPLGIFLGWGLTFVFYILPLLIATGATANQQNDWVDGHLASVSSEIVGPWLGFLIVFGAGISSLAQFEAEMSSNSYLLMGMAARGHMPQFFAHRSSRFGTPTNGILAATIVVVCLGTAGFSRLIEMLNFNDAISLLMEYAAFVRLRHRIDDHRFPIERPFRTPIPDNAAILLVLPPSIMIIIMLLLTSWVTLVFIGTTLILGCALHCLLQSAQDRDWCDFVGVGYTERLVDGEEEEDEGNAAPTV